MNVELIDFLLGFGVVLLLLQITYLVFHITIKFGKDLGLGVPVVMVIIDFMALVAYMYAMKPFANNARIFAGGIGLAIFISMIHKITKFIKDIPK
tara:strand:+ start:1078 stop:1362 length:285 start_codon:yes stop_codon:yes gene_type:complete